MVILHRYSPSGARRPTKTDHEIGITSPVGAEGAGVLAVLEICSTSVVVLDVVVVVPLHERLGLSNRRGEGRSHQGQERCSVFHGEEE